jgi:hypothetical protein
MASKPYFDSIQARSALLKLIEKLDDANSSLITEKVKALYSFYRNSAPMGREFVVDYGVLEEDFFKVSYSRLEELLLKKVAKARSEKTFSKYSEEAVELAVSLWESFYSVERTSAGGYVAKTRPIT